MATRFSDYNLSGETIDSLLGECNSGISPVAHLPIPEHKALAMHLAQIDKARQELAAYNSDETDEEFFDFGPEDFDENPTAAEALWMNLNTWRESKAEQPPEAALGGEEAINEEVPLKKKVSKKPVSTPEGDETE